MSTTKRIPYVEARVGDVLYWEAAGGPYMFGPIIGDEGDRWLVRRNPYGGVCTLPKEPGDEFKYINCERTRCNP